MVRICLPIFWDFKTLEISNLSIRIFPLCIFPFTCPSRRFCPPPCSQLAFLDPLTSILLHTMYILLRLQHQIIDRVPAKFHSSCSIYCTKFNQNATRSFNPQIQCIGLLSGRLCLGFIFMLNLGDLLDERFCACCQFHDVKRAQVVNVYKVHRFFQIFWSDF